MRNDKTAFAALLLAALALLCAGPALADAKGDARAAMQGTIDEVLRSLRVPGVDEATRRAQIEAIAKQ
ncbi:MAG TPA: hypothetical protein VII78_04255, partial [Myxococcota bacterium]